jgi:hypothetical protein
MSESKELTVPERAAVALGADEGEKALIALSKKYVDIVEIKNPAARQQCHAAAMELGNARIATTKTGEVAREDANAFQKAVIAEVKRRVAIISAEETRLLALRDAWDKEREAEKAAKAAAEKARVDGIRAKIDEIKDCIVFAMGKSASEIQGAIDKLSAHEITLEEFQELAGEAEMSKVATLAKLHEALIAQQAHEAEQARIAAEREALERQRAELAEQERLAAVERAQREAMDRAERERVAAEQRAAQERAAEAMRQQQAEHEARMRAQQAEIDRQQAEIAAARAEQERIAREAQERAEAAAKLEADHAEAITENAAIDALRKLAAEARRQEEKRRADEEEQKRRERVDFIKNGPGDVEILKLVASHYAVTYQTACNWVGKIEFIEFPDTIETEKAA